MALFVKLHINCMQTNFVVAHQQEIDLLQHGARKLIKLGKNSEISTRNLYLVVDDLDIFYFLWLEDAFDFEVLIKCMSHPMHFIFVSLYKGGQEV